MVGHTIWQGRRLRRWRSERENNSKYATILGIIRGKWRRVLEQLGGKDEWILTLSDFFSQDQDHSREELFNVDDETLHVKLFRNPQPTSWQKCFDRRSWSVTKRLKVVWNISIKEEQDGPVRVAYEMMKNYLWAPEGNQKKTDMPNFIKNDGLISLRTRSSRFNRHQVILLLNPTNACDV